MALIGIDLGTTNSAMAIWGQRAGDQFYRMDACPNCSIILDERGRRFMPSVVAEDDDGKILVGSRAKARAGMTPEPIMFAKRVMGRVNSFPLKTHDPLQPEQVSAYVLRKLKMTAEKQLGETVEEAVITVPAYFTIRAKQMTEKAGNLAGLKVAQLAQEPVAAALMYFSGESRDPLRIMTYDLGGGTFDVAILEKLDGVITNDSVLSYDGDPFLGGYNFDKALATWIMNQLIVQKYKLDLDLNKPADKAIFAKLMVIAEKVKIQLSDEQFCEINETTTGITDHSGEPVAIHMDITRSTFEDMIRKDVEYSLEICRRALTDEKADKPIPPESIDQIIMVGGSARIPLVAQYLEKAFGKKPKLVEPDLCVALGAAIIAGAGDQHVGRFKLNAIPRQTDLPSLTVTGELMADEKLKDVSGCTVTLRAEDGSYKADRTTSADGAFAFDSVGLAIDDTMAFALFAKAPNGKEVARHRFEVTHTPNPEETTPTVPENLSKPILMMTKDGPYVIAPVRTPLAYQTVIQAEVADASGTICIPILEENNTLGQIVMEDIPKTLPVGSEVEITVTVQKNFKIEAQAYIKALARTKHASIRIPPPPQKSLKELEAEYEKLVDEADDAVRSGETGEAFSGAKGLRVKQRLAASREMLNDRDPDQPRIQDCLDQVRTMIEQLKTTWRPEPPRAMFEAKVEETRELIQRLVTEKPAAAEDGYEDQLKAIKTEAEQAYAARNNPEWNACYERTVKLCDTVYGRLKPTQGPQDPTTLLVQLAEKLGTLKEEAEENGKLAKPGKSETEEQAELRKQFEDAAQSLEKIDAGSPRVGADIREWYYTKFQPLLQELEKPEEDGLLKVLGAKPTRAPGSDRDPSALGGDA